MEFCIRRPIDISNAEESLKRVRGLPVEVSLRFSVSDLLRERHLLMDVRRLAKENAVIVRSVHVPLVRFTDEYFRNAARLIVAFAESVNAAVIVLHPEKTNGTPREDARNAALANIKLLQKTTRVKIAVETFWDHEHILSPDEIMQHHLPMVLDTSLIPKPEITWIVEAYRTHLVNLHLSAVAHGAEQHLAGRQFRPIENDPFCLDVLDRLQELNWNGVVTLEYLPWLSDKSVEDRKLLENIYHDIA